VDLIKADSEMIRNGSLPMKTGICFIKARSNLIIRRAVNCRGSSFAY